MAKDLCIFCGIDEAAYRWRQAGLVRLDNASGSDKGKGKEKLSVPERLEGRRRMCIKVAIDGVTSQELEYTPTIDTPHEDDMHSALVQVQQELFEEEIFAEVSCDHFIGPLNTMAYVASNLRHIFPAYSRSKGTACWNHGYSQFSRGSTSRRVHVDNRDEGRG